LVFRFSGVPFFEANDDFATEHAIACELGVRHQPADTLVFDLSAFTYRYDDLRSTEPIGAAAVPLTFRNRLNAESYGAEVMVMYQPLSRLFFKGSYRFLDLQFWRDPGSQDTSGGSSEGNDPRHLATLGAHLDLPGNVELDAFVRHASALPRPATPAYTTADLRIGWRPTERWEIELAGRNLLDRQHRELVTTNSLNEEVGRSGSIKATWRY
jgi:iron complex outermembrane recepter protein